MRFLTRIFSSNDEEEEDIISDVTNGNTLSWSTRIKCFLFCFLFGIFLSVMVYNADLMMNLYFVIPGFRQYILSKFCHVFNFIFHWKCDVNGKIDFDSGCNVDDNFNLVFCILLEERCPVSSVCVLPISGDDLVLFVVYSIREIRREKLLANVRLINNLPITYVQLRIRLPFRYSRRQNKQSVHNFIYTVDVTSCPVKLNNYFNFNFSSNIWIFILACLESKISQIKSFSKIKQ
ncbi:Vesicle transport protein SFT2A [Trichinella spiralis]|uniref:Vesicle transport protein SFT2A n=1 Tax=Trichinella spiralis TaxID=6334 RepID=A0A0V1BJG2_TRISP|nr:Vesicle transport protein SFT2A [Trichinella spiralis]